MWKLRNNKSSVKGKRQPYLNIGTDDEGDIHVYVSDEDGRDKVTVLWFMRDGFVLKNETLESELNDYNYDCDDLQFTNDSILIEN